MLKKRTFAKDKHISNQKIARAERTSISLKKSGEKKQAFAKQKLNQLPGAPVLKNRVGRTMLAMRMMKKMRLMMHPRLRLAIDGAAAPPGGGGSPSKNVP